MERIELMPRYYFALRWPDCSDDDKEGTVLPNDDAAFRYAQRIIAELREGGYDGSSFVIDVTDEGGRTVFSLPFSGSTAGHLH